MAKNSGSIANGIGHIAVITICGSLSIFMGMPGLIIGIVGFVLFALYTE